MPMLIYVVLHANPEHLVSNVQYILRFRSQEKLGGEAGYYLSSLVCALYSLQNTMSYLQLLTKSQMGAVQFIENMDRTTLTITDEEFETHVEAAVSAIAEKHRSESPPPPPPHAEKPMLQPRPVSSAGDSLSSAKRVSLEVDPSTLRPSTPRASTSSNEGGGGSGSGGEYSGSEEKAAITGLLRSIQKPLSTIGRMFSEDPAASSSAVPAVANSPARTPQPQGEQLIGDFETETKGGELRKREKLSAEEAAARQASAEAAEAQRLHRAEHANVVETLAGMFPDLDRELISDVVYEKEGR